MMKVIYKRVRSMQIKRSKNENEAIKRISGINKELKMGGSGLKYSMYRLHH